MTPNPFGGAAPVGRGRGGSTTTALWYLHSLTIASGTAWGNSESTRNGTPTMESNGIQGVMQTAGTATPDSLATSWGYTWPVTVVRDVNGAALPSTFNMGLRPVRMAVLERSVSATPAECGVLFGFCDNADVTAAQSLFGLGLCWDTTTLRSVMAVKKVGGSQTLQTAGTGQSTCFGSEVTQQVIGPTNSHSSVFVPLDSGFDHLTASSNSITHNTTNIPVTGMTHIFVAFLYTVASSVLTPTIRFDASVNVPPRLDWE